MFSIIIAIIAIVLTILLSIVTISYLHDDGENAAKTKAARIIQEAAQIQGAIIIARTDGIMLNTNSSLEEIHPLYLADIPQDGEKWDFAKNLVYKTDVEDNVCLAANLSTGFVFTESMSDVRKADNSSGYIPYCDKPDLSGNTPCCDNSRVEASSTASS